MTKSLYLLGGTITLICNSRSGTWVIVFSTLVWFGWCWNCSLHFGNGWCDRFIGCCRWLGSLVLWCCFFVRQKFALLLIWCRLVCWSHMFTIPSVGLPIGYHKVWPGSSLFQAGAKMPFLELLWLSLGLGAGLVLWVRVLCNVLLWVGVTVCPYSASNCFHGHNWGGW